jgi:cell division protein FtsB
MRTANPIAPALFGGRASMAPARSPFATRRRVFLGVVLLLLVGLAVLTNYGPMRAYRESQARLEKAASQVAVLAEQKEQLRQELGKLGEAGYLESLARQELTYARPGEEVYIVTGSAEEQAADEKVDTLSPSAVERPGLLERMLSAIGDLF